MLRVQASIVSQDGCKYTVEALAEGIDTPFLFQIDAKSDNEAAMEAIRRVEAFGGLINNDKRTN
jgi:hypothetical protein